ncbi:MAG: HesA/MoeB/ThiF family protein [Pseudomonadota bacterium]
MGAPVVSLAPEEIERYARHIFLREIGGPGQQKLKAARVAVVGAGGLGASALMYLAAAGVGHIRVIDDDVVDLSNLQRQVIHDTTAVGTAKVESAQARMGEINPHVEVEPRCARLNAETAEELLGGVDLVLDGSDGFETRYLVNATCVALDLPLISAAMTQWEGQIGLYRPSTGGPCYRGVFPNRPAPGLVPSCAEAGIMGALAGVMGSRFAPGARKWMTGAGGGL